MKPVAVLILAAATLIAGAASSEDRVTLGWGRLFSNDAIGDQHDRWHTGSYTISRIAGLRWRGDLPEAPGQILEYRFSADIYAPADLITPAADDRRYAGALTFGAATHFDFRGNDTTLGAGLTFIGPSTGLGLFQSQMHELFGMDVPTTVLDDQIEDQIQPYASAEISRSLSLNDQLTLRPYLGAQIGAEDYLRVGADLVLGRMGAKDLMLRDGATGHLYRGVVGDGEPQISLIFGADHAEVFNSVFLPEGGAAVLTQGRDRLRIGSLWQGQSAFIFSGLTYLSPEFDSQPEGQLLGSVTLSLAF